MKKSDDILSGMDEISQHINRSPATVLDWIRKAGFPASKIGGGGVWESSKALVEVWRQERILLELGIKIRPPVVEHREVLTLSKRKGKS